MDVSDVERLAFSQKQKQIDEYFIEYNGKRYLMTKRGLAFHNADQEMLRTVIDSIKLTTGDKPGFYSHFNVEKNDDGLYTLSFYWLEDPAALQ